MSAAQVTEAHLRLANQLVSSPPSPLVLATLIADSEAKAVAEWQNFVHLKGEAIDSLLMECNRLRAERDALLEIAWLDTPDEPHENVGQWRVEFCNGWERRSVYDKLRAELARLDTEKPWLKEANATVAKLRAEVERLRDGLRDSEAALALNTLRAERAEAKLNESRYETVKAAQEGLRECIRAERAEAELAAEWARHTALRRAVLDVLCDPEGKAVFAGTDADRAAIDLAMKEGAK